MDAASTRGVELEVLRLTDPRAAVTYGADLLLVRPDQIVAWRGSDGACDPVAIFDRVLGIAGEDHPKRDDNGGKVVAEGSELSDR